MIDIGFILVILIGILLIAKLIAAHFKTRITQYVIYLIAGMMMIFLLFPLYLVYMFTYHDAADQWVRLQRANNYRPDKNELEKWPVVTKDIMPKYMNWLNDMEQIYYAKHNNKYACNFEELKDQINDQSMNFPLIYDSYENETRRKTSRNHMPDYRIELACPALIADRYKAIAWTKYKGFPMFRVDETGKLLITEKLRWTFPKQGVWPQDLKAYPRPTDQIDDANIVDVTGKSWGHIQKQVAGPNRGTWSWQVFHDQSHERIDDDHGYAATQEEAIDLVERNLPIAR